MAGHSKVNKKEVYLMLVGDHPDCAGYQFTASKISHLLGISRQRVSRIVAEFKQKSLIHCIEERAKCKVYVRTHRRYNTVYEDAVEVVNHVVDGSVEGMVNQVVNHETRDLSTTSSKEKKEENRFSCQPIVDNNVDANVDIAIVDKKTAGGKRLETYQLLAGVSPRFPRTRFTVSETAEILGVSRQYIHRLSCEFIKNKVLEKDEKTPKGIIFRATTIDFKSIYGSVQRRGRSLYQIDPIKTSGGYPELPPTKEYDISKSKYKVKIERMYSDFWDNVGSYTFGNCICRPYTTKIFDGMGEWTFELQGKNTLIISVPRMRLSPQYLGSTRLFVTNLVFEALKVFCKQSSTRLDFLSLKLVQGAHVETPVLDSQAIRVGRDFSLNIDGHMIDASSSKVDWEGGMFDDEMVEVAGLLEHVSPLTALQSELSIVTGIADDAHSRIDKLEKENNALTTCMNALLDNMNELKKLILEHVPDNTSGVTGDNKMYS